MKFSEIKNGALYKVGGVICRVSDKNMFWGEFFIVSHHKRFECFAKPRELKKATKAEVNKYLKEAKSCG